MKLLINTSQMKSLVILGLSSMSLSAATIDWGGAAFQEDYFSDGTVLDDTVTFQLGYFSSITPEILNTADWQANWVALDESSYNTDNNLFGGTYDTRLDLSVPLPAEGTQLYIWGFNSQEISETTEWALISDLGVNSEWVSPNLTGSNQGSFTVQLRPSSSQDAVIGRTPTDTGGGRFTDTPELGTSGVQFFTIPEPSSLMMALLGCMGLFIRRRN